MQPEHPHLTDDLRTGDARMDDTHDGFMQQMQLLRRTPASDRLPAYDALVAHTEAHFAQEAQWMVMLGMGDSNCHTGQHANVLETMREVARRAHLGDMALIERMLDALDEWFPLHVAAMDSALAEALRLHAGAQPEAAMARSSVLSTLP